MPDEAMRPIRAVILDVDGTLIRSNDEHARAFLEAAGELGLARPPFDEVRRLIGKGGDKLIPEAFGFEKESENGQRLDTRKGEIFRERYAPDLEPTPGARPLLRRFRDAGFRRVVATSANEEDLQLLLEKAGVADLIDASTSADDVDESKPDPDIVRAALELSGAPADEVVMLGDTPYDVEAALRAGIRIIAVRSGGWSGGDLDGAIGIFDDPADLLTNWPVELFGDVPAHSPD